MAEISVPKVPNLDITDCRFLAVHGPAEMRKRALDRLAAEIKANNMAPLYMLIAEDELKQPVDKNLLSSMQAANAEEIKKLDERLADAEENLGETDVSDALAAKAEYLTNIGEKENAVTAWRVAMEKTAGIGQRLDIVFMLIRIGFFFNDAELISRNIAKAKSLIEEGGDWDRRNRLKVYEGIHLLSIRDFKGAADLLLSTLSTFTSTELMEYKDFVKYTVLSSIFALDRVDTKKKVLHAPEIMEVLHEIPHLEEYMRSLYDCNYAKFFKALAAIEEAHLRTSRILFNHRQYYVREMRIKAYAQLLESYRSLTLESMAHAFGVGDEFIDNDLSRFVAAGRVNCVIDKVNGVVETNRPDAKNAQYQQCIKQGDLLLNRVQKLSRVINV